MIRPLAILAAAAAGTVLAACGHGSTPPAAVDPAASVDANAPPTWGGCRAFSGTNIDYSQDARGSTSVMAAIAPYRQPGDHVVKRHRRPHRTAAWLLVDDRNVIHTSLELWHAQHGWLVGLVEKCAD